MEVLILCSGNIVRSPFAEGLLRKILGDIGVKDVLVSSAGTLGIEGQPADPESVRLARERGFDLRAHRSRGLQMRDVSRADLIVCMEASHARRVKQIDPSAASRVKLLTEFETESERAPSADVIDPIGGDREAFRSCFELIERCIVNLAFNLKYRYVP